MQPRPEAPQDRPKLIAVSIGIALAGGFLVRNLMGVTRLAQPRQPEAIAANLPAGRDNGPEASLCRRSGLPETAMSGQCSGWDDGDSDGSRDGAGAARPPALPDPFYPISTATAARGLQPQRAPRPAASSSSAGRTVSMAGAAALPAKAAARAPAVHGPAGGGRGAEPAGMERPAAAPRRSQPGPGAQSPLRLRAEAESQPSTPPQPSAESPALIGTVGSGATAVAMFRVGRETVYVQPQEVVAGWRVARIDVGRVFLTRRNTRQQVLAGNSVGEG